MTNGSVEMASANTACTVDAGRAAILELLQRGVVGAEDVSRLRREFFSEGGASQAQAEALFAIERSGIAGGAEWTEFFVETITSHVVWELRPTGIVSEEQAQWLIDQVDRTKSITALAALINVLAEADRIPAWLPAAARGRAAAGWKGVDEALDAARSEARIAA